MSVWRHVYLQPLTRVHHVELLHRRSNDVNERVISSVPLYYPLIFRCYVMHVFVKATDRENFLIPSSRQMYFREITAICYDETCFDTPIMDHLMEDKLLGIHILMPIIDLISSDWFWFSSNTWIVGAHYSGLRITIIKIFSNKYDIISWLLSAFWLLDRIFSSPNGKNLWLIIQNFDEFFLSMSVVFLRFSKEISDERD